MFFKYNSIRQIGAQIFNKKYFSSKKTLYQILESNQDADLASIKKSYHRLAKQYHPDININFEEKFKEINSAYEILKNPDKRKAYDQDLNQKNFTEQKNSTEQNFYSSNYSQSYQQNSQRSENFNKKGYYEQKRDPYDEMREELKRAKEDYEQKEQNYKDDYKKFYKGKGDGGDLVEEGFIKNLNAAPELYILTGVMLLLIGQFYYNFFKEQDIRKRQDEKFAHLNKNEFSLYYQDAHGKSIKKQQLDKQSCQGKTIDELIEMEKYFVLPTDIEMEIEDYKEQQEFQELLKKKQKPTNHINDTENQYQKRPLENQFQIFNYNKKHDITDNQQNVTKQNQQNDKQNVQQNDQQNDANMREFVQNRKKKSQVEHECDAASKDNTYSSAPNASIPRLRTSQYYNSQNLKNE